jgi:hypothetical protein
MIQYYVKGRSKYANLPIAVGPLHSEAAADKAAIVMAAREDVQADIHIETYTDKENK